VSSIKILLIMILRLIKET